eukprot:1190706-Prorocentrum_minimum.AAC.2
MPRQPNSALFASGTTPAGRGERWTPSRRVHCTGLINYNHPRGHVRPHRDPPRRGYRAQETEAAQTEEADGLGGAPEGRKASDGQGKEMGELLGHEEVSNPLVPASTRCRQTPHDTTLAHGRAPDRGW